jgi:hypothetical protein
MTSNSKDSDKTKEIYRFLKIGKTAIENGRKRPFNDAMSDIKKEIALRKKQFI